MVDWFAAAKLTQKTRHGDAGAMSVGRRRHALADRHCDELGGTSLARFSTDEKESYKEERLVRSVTRGEIRPMAEPNASFECWRPLRPAIQILPAVVHLDSGTKMRKNSMEGNLFHSVYQTVRDD